MRSIGVLALGAIALTTGCAGVPGAGAGAGMLLKSPATDKCEESSLKGCPELVDGVLLYIDGKNKEGTDKVKRAAALNTPESLKAYSKALRLVALAPGAQSYSKPINDVCDVLENASAHSDAQAKLDAPSTRHGEDAEPSEFEPPPRGENISLMRTVTVMPMPGGSAKTSACAPLSNIEGAAPPGSGTCARAGVGPVVLTDLDASGGCPYELFVAVGDIGAPEWFMFVPAGSPLSVHGAALLVAPDQVLNFGVVMPAGTAAKPDRRCSVTWSGHRPR